MALTPKNVILAWVEAFNDADVEALVQLYHPDAINHQVAYEPVQGHEALRDLFAKEFGRASMNCVIENLFQDGEWAILEWSDPVNVRGCGFFQVRQGLIVFQRGYFDKLSFYEAQGLPPDD